MRRSDQFGAFVRRLVGALGERGDLRRGIIVAVVPFLALGGDGAQPVIGKLGFARDRLRLTALFGAGSALAHDCRIDSGELAFDVGGVRQGGERLLRLGTGERGLVARRADPLPRLLERRNARRIAANLPLGGGVLLARGIGRVLGLAPAGARLRFSRDGGAERRFGGLDDTAFAFDLGAGGRKLAFDRQKPAAFGEPPRRAGRGMGGDGKTVPAPEIAFARHQPLPRLEHRGQARSFGAVDHADLGEAALEFGRRFDIFRQRHDAVRQMRIGRIERRAGPVHRGRRADRRVEIVPQSRAECLFVAFGHGDGVHHRGPEILAFDREQLADGLGLGLEPLHAPFGGSQRRPRGVDLFAGAPMRGFRGMRRPFRLRERGLRFGNRSSQRRQVRRAGVGRGEAGLDIGELSRKPGGALLVFAQAGLQLVAAGGEVGKRAGQFGKGFFRSRECGICGGDATVGAGKLRVGFLSDRDQRPLFGVEPLQRRRGVGRQRPLAGEVSRELLDAAIELADAFLGAGLLAFQRLARDDEALQTGRGRGFRFAQGRQPGGDVRLAGGGLRVFAGARRNHANGLILGAAGFADFAARRDPAQVKQQRFGAAHLAGNIAVAHRLPRLGFQRRDLGGQLPDDVLDPHQVRLGRLEPQLRFVAPRMQPGNAGRLFQHAPALIRPRLDDLADAALVHQGG